MGAYGTGKFGIGAYGIGSAVINPAPDGSGLPNTLALDIIKRALRLLGVVAAGESPGDEETEDGLIALNSMIDSWTAQGLPCYQQINNTFPTTAGKSYYTIGPDTSADFNTTRPMQITSAVYRSGITDYVLEQMTNRQYQGIADKATASTHPHYFMYTPAQPFGIVYLYPVPVSTGSITISQLKQLARFVTLEDVVNVPPGYKEAMTYNLAVELAPEYGKEASNTVQNKAIESLAQIKRNNIVVEKLSMGADVLCLGARNRYNIYTDWWC